MERSGRVLSFDSTPSEAHPGQNGRVQAEWRPQRWNSLLRSGNLVYATFYCFVSALPFVPVLVLQMLAYKCECKGIVDVISTVPSDGRGRWAVRDFPRTDGTAPRPAVPSLLHNDGMTSGDLPGTVKSPSPAVIHRPRQSSTVPGRQRAVTEYV
ncbi:hypothetical protein K440DRAFT_646588 [Wilcoxina mikolae CBS 423.85]|nr:hypothetical protein K440DRAFT_646588 [Wilcoxina mikolae CBS 423.85]